jgi:ethanolamine permease
MKTSANFELTVTVIALVGLVVYWLLAAPHFEASRVLTEPLLPGGFDGVMAAVPFAIWFYLAIEGGAMSAEEMVNPQRDIPKGFLTGMATLLIMAALTLFLTAGIADVDAISAVDFPLPLALSAIYGDGSLPVLLMSGIGLFGLVASLHGIIVGYSRQAYAMARTGYLPKFLAKLDPKHHTPVWSLVLPGIVCLFTALTGLTDMVITIACYGSVIMYITSLAAFFILRHKEPELKRPFRVSSLLIPVVSMITAIFCLVSLLMASSSVLPYVIGIYVVAILYYFVHGNKHIRPFEEEFGVLDELDEG